MLDDRPSFLILTKLILLRFSSTFKGKILLETLVSLSLESRLCSMQSLLTLNNLCNFFGANSSCKLVALMKIKLFVKLCFSELNT